MAIGDIQKRPYTVAVRPFGPYRVTHDDGSSSIFMATLVTERVIKHGIASMWPVDHRISSTLCTSISKIEHLDSIHKRALAIKRS